MGLTISVTIIAAVMVLALIFLIPLFLQVRRTAREVEKTLETTRMQIVPLSHDLTIIFQEVNGILRSIRRQVDKVEEGITTIKNTAVRLRDFEEEIFRRIEDPLLELATLISAVSRGVERFVRVLRR